MRVLLGWMAIFYPLYLVILFPLIVGLGARVSLCNVVFPEASKRHAFSACLMSLKAIWNLFCFWSVSTTDILVVCESVMHWQGRWIGFAHRKWLVHLISHPCCHVTVQVDAGGQGLKHHFIKHSLHPYACSFFMFMCYFNVTWKANKRFHWVLLWNKVSN